MKINTMDSNNLKTLINELKSWENINSAARFFIKNICQLNNWVYGEFWLPDKDNTFMIWSGCWSKDEDYFEKFSKFSLMHKFSKGVGLIGKIWEEKNLIWINDLFSNTNFLRTELAIKSRLNSAIGIPILNEEKVILLLCFFLNNLSSNDQENAKAIFSHSEEIGEILAKLD